MRWLELMKIVWDVAIMIDESGYHSLEILFKVMPEKKEKYQISSDKYHFDRVKIIQHYRKQTPANMAGAGLKVTAI
ncbi:hypothetical protein RF663_05205 [Aeromonas veronii]|uniref:hypothetical protein n=1 Tax=Aeromonas veronii TaxID=654 RepID=UPI0028536C0D|nr:hypothetical protein [Aeromonas veronii]MDR5013648.1 hypothetical protein [Aeromonas veronii]